MYSFEQREENDESTIQMDENEIDKNVNNYTLSELLTILDIQEPTKKNILDKTNHYIQKFTNENNLTMVTFFEDIQVQLLDTYSTNKPNQDSQTIEWWQNEALKQEDKNQTDKNTERKQKVDIYKEEHLPMKREQLGVNNTYSVPVVQDSLNPNLKNTITRIVNLDSQYRQTTNPSDSSTDYTLDLSEPLLNTLSLSLYSFQIPYTWYSLDVAYGNTCFWISFTDASNGNILETVAIHIDAGNYNSTTFLTAINQSFQNSGFVVGLTSPVIYNAANGKITMNLLGTVYINPEDETISYTVDTTTILTFFDPSAKLQCGSSCVQTLAVNQTLGWIMGYRVPSILVSTNGNTGEAILDLYGPKYFILAIDDFNQNRINSGLIGITEYSTYLKLPSYYSPDLPYVCTRANPLGTNLRLNSLLLENDVNAGTLIMDKYDATYKHTQTILPSAPRVLTQTQMYTINEIMKNNEKNTNYKLTSPTTQDTFAIIPVKHNGMTTGSGYYVEFSGSLQDNKRIYFGPVNITRIRIKLLDDKGNILNLNGGDWSVTLLSENLYQY